jgi:prophage regulatory protein
MVRGETQGAAMESESNAVRPLRMVRMAEAEHRSSRARSSIYRDIKAGRMPAPVRIGPRAVAWPSDIFERWLASLRDGGAAAK